MSLFLRSALLLLLLVAVAVAVLVCLFLAAVAVDRSILLLSSLRTLLYLARGLGCCRRRRRC